MADIEADLYELETRMLNEGAGRYLAAVEELKRLVAMSAPGIVELVQTMATELNVQAAASAIEAAYATAIADAGATVALTATAAQLDALVQHAARPLSAPIDDLRAIQARVIGDVLKARLLIASGAEPATAAGAIIAGGRKTTMQLQSMLTEHAARGTMAAARVVGKPMVWVAERDACVRCLAHSGHVVEVGQAFPAGLTYGPYTYDDAVLAPPLHPYCRCHLEVLNDPSYAAALRREADRSVLRGYSLESEPMGVRVGAAKKLVESGVDAPKSVIGYAESAVRRGSFKTRSVPRARPAGPDDAPPPAPPKPPTPTQPRHDGPAADADPATKLAAIRAQVGHTRAMTPAQPPRPIGPRPAPAKAPAPKVTAPAKKATAPKATTRPAEDPTLSSIEGKSFDSMTNAEKLKATAIMYGRGSREYATALKKWRR